MGKINCLECVHSTVCMYKEKITQVEEMMEKALPDDVRAFIILDISCKHQKIKESITIKTPIDNIGGSLGVNPNPPSLHTMPKNTINMEMVNETNSSETLNIVQTSHVRGV